MSLLGLSGSASQVIALPAQCEECASRAFYKQPDFRRSIGVGVVTVMSVVSFVLMGMGYGWFLFMSPMLVALIVDRYFAHTRKLAVICYKCSHIYRGLSEAQLESVEAFDLEHFDRIHYAARTGETKINP
ncbi:MAG: hypothetical protein ABIR96_12965 [Bdellovibrionota bacterium]